MKFSDCGTFTTSPHDASFEYRKPTFLSLPAEIRHRIYEFHFSSQIGIVVKYWCGPIDHWGLTPIDSYWDWKPGHHMSNLLRACKQIAAEAAPVVKSVRPTFSFAFPYVGRHNLPGLRRSLARRVRTVEINSRGIPPLFQDFTSILNPDVGVVTLESHEPRLRYDRGPGHVQEVMIHSHTSLPIKPRALGHKITELCERETTANAHQGLLQRCFHQAKVALFNYDPPKDLDNCGNEWEYDEDLFQEFKKVLGRRTVKIRWECTRCSRRYLGLPSIRSAGFAPDWRQTCQPSSASTS